MVNKATTDEVIVLDPLRPAETEVSSVMDDDTELDPDRPAEAFTSTFTVAETRLEPARSDVKADPAAADAVSVEDPLRPALRLKRAVAADVRVLAPDKSADMSREGTVTSTVRAPLPVRSAETAVATVRSVVRVDPPERWAVTKSELDAARPNH